jgi:S-adenosylmethionine uptake transporter
MIRVSPALAIGVACVAIATFAGMDAVMKGQSIALGAYNAMLWRSVAGFLLSGALYLIRREPWPDRATLIVNVKRSLAGGCSVLMFFWGLVRVPMGEGVALTFLAPLIAILLAAVMLGERVRREALIACIIAFAGVIVIVFARAEQANGARALAGQGAIVLASVFYAYNLVQLRRAAQASGPIVITFITNVVMLGLFGIASPFAAIWPARSHWPWLFAAAALATVSSVLLAWAYAHAETQKLVPVEYTAFIWATLFGALFFGEQLVPITYVGVAMIVAGAIFGSRRQRGPVSEAAL